ncbi:MAG: NAD(P)-dependent oxidoreductase [Planctomycetes bacterium]|nr:NAD(P)-dependent oxidoreductase [Planctomycetota bacterium]MBI3843869.1 NAD(P)-dependent oxidoreductase [Planctomycetota bacterium]
MILVDKALDQRERDGTPIRVAMVGAGFMGRAIARQLVSGVRGIRLAVIVARRSERALAAFHEAGVRDAVIVSSVRDLESAIDSGRPAVTCDPAIVCHAEPIDAVIEVTGSIDPAATTVLEAMRCGKDVVLMNAELDGTLGPILKAHADAAGVVFTDAEGDQPAVILNLFRFVRGIGARPVLCGNIKGFLDRHGTPASQATIAAEWNQDPRLITSFTDGTKLSFEMATVANATGMGVARRGMVGPTVPTGTDIQRTMPCFPLETIGDRRGFVDYVVGASPSPGVFVVATHDDPAQRRYLKLYKLGEGPFYCFSTPQHLCHFEIQNSIARAVIFGDAAIAPLAGPIVHVIAVTKCDLDAGTELDGIGGFTAYGVCENADVVQSQNLLPIGLAARARLRRSLTRDQAITLDDVEFQAETPLLELWSEQRARFGA